MTESGREELDLRAVIGMMWRDRMVVGVIAIGCLLLGLAAYYALPRVYESSIRIVPLTAPHYAGYMNLTSSDYDLTAANSAWDSESQLVTQQIECKLGEPSTCLFPYAPVDLFAQYVVYVQDSALLLDTIGKSPAAKAAGLTEDEARRAGEEFRTSLTFTVPTTKDSNFVVVRARGPNATALERLMTSLLQNASAKLAADVKAASLGKVEAGRAKNVSQIDQLRAEIATKKVAEEQARLDQIAMLTEQYKIAEALGWSTPVAVPAGNAGVASGGAGPVVVNGSLPKYFEGTKSLAEQIELLKNRKESAGLVWGLRDLEQRVALLQQSTWADEAARAVEMSPLKDPASAPMVEYDILTVAAKQTFPKLSLFLIGAVGLGLLAGAGFAFARNKPR